MAVRSQDSSGRAVQVLGKGRAEMQLVIAACWGGVCGSKGSTVNPHVADGFLAENPTSSHSRSSLYLAKAIMLLLSPGNG